ncbi:MAG: DUF4834 family protein [Flavobacteriales bacterium]
MSLFRTLLVILLVYAIIRFFVRVIAPLLLRSYIKKKQEEWQQQAQGGKPQRPKGEVHIERKPGKSRKNPRNDEGEYVDYEEVD